MDERIIKAALELFSHYGIKWVSMEQVSKKVGISKKTLYEEVTGKDELVNKVVAASHRQLWQTLAEIERSSFSEMNTILQIFFAVHRYTNSFCLAFYEDLRTYSSAETQKAHAQEKLKQIYLRLFTAGVNKGLFIPQENYEHIAHYYSSWLNGNYSDTLMKLIFSLLRGICTEKGILELQKYKSVINPVTNQTQYVQING